MLYQATEDEHLHKVAEKFANEKQRLLNVSQELFPRESVRVAM